MQVTKQNLRNKLFDYAIQESHNTAIEVYSADVRTARDGYRCYGRFSQALDLLDDFNLITPHQSEKINDLIPNDEAVSKYLRRIK